MDSKEFSKHLIREYDIEMKDGTLHINDAHPLTQEMDYSDDDSVNILTTKTYLTTDTI